MARKKTAISIEQPLFEEIEALAKEMEVSRSQVFAVAAREFIRYHKNQKLLDATNNAYKDTPDLDEEALKTRMKSKHRRLVKEQW
jgi:metal-responsive CopG/Arc/MetJ family transcriptional regulator